MPHGPYREGSLKVGDRLVAMETTNLSQASHMEALNFIRQGSSSAVLRFEYDVSIMGEWSGKKKLLVREDGEIYMSK